MRLTLILQVEVAEDATANALSPFLRTDAGILLYKKVFPVPPGPSIKKALPFS